MAFPDCASRVRWDERVFHKLIEPVEVDLGEDGTDHAPLRCPAMGGVIDVVETSPDVPLDKPCGPAPGLMDLVQGRVAVTNGCIFPQNIGCKFPTLEGLIS